MTHNFNIGIAIKTDLEKAILLYNINFWVSTNKANNRNKHGNSYWSYNSSKAFAEIFPYMKQSTISRKLNELVNDGWLLSGNYNKTSFDRTKWYTITNKYHETIKEYHHNLSISQNDKSIDYNDESNNQNDESNNQNGQTIPDIKPDIKPDVSKSEELTYKPTQHEIDINTQLNNFVKFKYSCLNRLGWIAGVQQMFYKQKYTEKNIYNLLDQFGSIQITQFYHGWSTESSFAKHFTNWVSMEIKKKEQKNRPNYNTVNQKSDQVYKPSKLETPEDKERRLKLTRLINKSNQMQQAKQNR